MMTIPKQSWLSDPNVFAVNRLPAHSDHVYYESVQEAEEKRVMPMRHDLNGKWKFHYAVNPQYRPKEFYKLDETCANWQDISVPSHIQLQGFGTPQYVNTMYPWDGHHHLRPPEVPMDDNPVGSYVKYFHLPKQMKGNRVYISFQGVESAFYIWLNGHFIGYSEDSFTPAEFDLSDHVIDGENKVAVEVYQRSTGSWLEDQDFWRFSGIFRDVYLYTIPEIHLFDVNVRAELDATYQKGTVTGQFTSVEDIPSGSELVGKLYDEEGRLVVTRKGTVSDGKWKLTLLVDAPQLWSAERPYLYELFIHIFNESGKLVEVIPQKIGFRKFELIDKVMCLNGKRIVFKGVNRHEFNCRKGRAITKEDMLSDIKTLKRHNINAVRTSHYPNQSYWYELCDEYGIYVMDEMNLETHGSWQKMGEVEPSWNIPGNKPEWQNIVIDRAKSMYERDKNHPSILIWSCGNESYAGEVILNVSKYFKEVDRSRLVHYEGVFHARDYDETSDMESRMYAKPDDIVQYLESNPTKPYISCEYMHAMGNSVGGMDKYTDLEAKYSMYQGGFIWDFIDQAILKKDRYGEEYFAYGGDYGDRPTDYSFCTNGIVYANRELSPKMQEVKSVYENVKLDVDKEGVTIKNDNLFISTEYYEVEYTLYAEGKEIDRNTINEVLIQPGGHKRLQFDFSKINTSGPSEYCIDVAVKLKESTLWAEAGFEVAFGQHVFQNGERTQKQSEVFTEQKREMKVVYGDVNIGVHGKGFSVLFSKQVGSLISLHYAGNEMISDPPVPMFWRATTENDKGYAQDYHSGVWYAASIARKCVAVDVEEKTDCISVIFTYRFSIHEEVKVQTKYDVFPNGSLRIKMDYAGAEGLPQMPAFALSFKVPADYDQLQWYALGPDENYRDRCHGARLGIFENTAAVNVSKYVVPQETGNRTGLRWVNVRNHEGEGIKVSSLEEQLDCTVTPYTAFELESAKHHFELPNVHYTVITVGKQMGVGGDDSWGAPVHEEYLLNGSGGLQFEFMIERI